jgi:transcription elongation factor Elf1
MAQKAKANSSKFTVPEVWRRIVKKNEQQGDKRFDVLICNHAVLANDNTYRRARSCPECRLKVQEYADQHGAGQAR